MIGKQLVITGMSCQHCVKALKIELDANKIAYKQVEVGSATLEVDETTVTDQMIKDVVQEAGYQVISITDAAVS